ncbi:MAG TPA: class I SAM-dependent methyltransferase [Solirubrobacteraceae bacterium]|nr:class I SAM-dependent methyltransferase [Solirubrobacteraceae bacterium]
MTLLPRRETARERWRTFVESRHTTFADPGAKVLDVGCGRSKFPGAVGMDRLENTDADVIHELDVLPYPLDDNSFDLVIARHVLEHVAAPLDVLAELHRVTRAGGEVSIISPHFASVTSWTDPTHRHHFSSRSFDYLLSDTEWNFYSNVRFELLDRRITLGMVQGPGGRVFPLLRLLGVEALVNRFIDVFERWWAFALPLGPKDLVIRLRVVK